MQHHHRHQLVARAVVAAALLVTAACASDSGHASTASTTAAKGGSTTTTVDTRPVASAGCRAEPAATAVDVDKRTITVGDLDRWYLLTVPAPASKPLPMPLLVDMHGLAEGAVLHAKMTGFGALGTREGFVTASPQGTGATPHWIVGPGGPAAGADIDIAFLGKMLDQIESAVCIDTSRVYATGLSHGAMMSSMVACLMADRFAAVAPVAGATAYTECHPTAVVPMLTIHGTADPILLFNGGVGDLSILGGPKPSTSTTLAPPDLNGAGYPANVKAWAQRNGCGATPTDTAVSKEVTLRTYPCPAGADVQMYIVTGGGHAWPGSEFSKAIAKVVGYTTFDIDATTVIWKFLHHFQRKH